ncbi:hypothetical protein JCM3263A_20970 [Thermobifida fusca]|jgi:chromosome condensin MukBEF complex kleisin-like MukF subunit|uniref:Uncharacterized protein n=1 Tax=Thermobifida fusca TM51 TaxID=1169414 RepID=A0A9P2TAP1_THEFU|nr:MULTISPECIES: hypothetical protein [Thermobifida]EOR71495.1 hypothetical protein TM51_07486 [Thermobifida fusca TM51]MBO2530872.1 hypothetical protein [Thermobifida sp.]PPS91921.1 hypothetical protein BH05_12605 [Thermobifida fusca]PZN64792.1 MAG: hypothetical protein DIU53_05240 [Thermobifida fusca]QOS58033.1 hypothetical protein IM867_11495 [Thermobifida fusca]
MVLTQVEPSATRTLNPFRRTRAIAEHTLREAKDDVTHLRLLSLFHALAACETALSQAPGTLREKLDALRTAVVDLVGEDWLTSHPTHPDVRAFRRLDDTALLSRLDEALSNLLRARFFQLAA